MAQTVEHGFTWYMFFKDFIGTIVALFVAMIGWIIAVKHFNKQQKTNTILEKERLKKQLQIKTTEEAVYHLEEIRANYRELMLYVLSLPGDLKLYYNTGIKIKNSWDSPPNMQVTEKWCSATMSVSKFMYFFEARQVILYQFIGMYNEITAKREEISKIVLSLSDFLREVYYQKYFNGVEFSNSELADLDKMTDEIMNSIVTLQAYTYDFLRELQNAFLSEEFGYKIPLRETADPTKFKVLTLENTNDEAIKAPNFE